MSNNQIPHETGANAEPVVPQHVTDAAADTVVPEPVTAADETVTEPAGEVPAEQEDVHAASPEEVLAEREAAEPVAVKRQKTTGLAKGPGMPGIPKVDPILVVNNVTRNFGGVSAVDVNHLEIPRHAITALIGPNGAGKTTLFNLLCGFDKPNTGSWTYDGHNLAGVPSFKVARMGQVRTVQLTKALSRPRC